jgi:hypothetical protein
MPPNFLKALRLVTAQEQGCTFVFIFSSTFPKSKDPFPPKVRTGMVWEVAVVLIQIWRQREISGANISENMLEGFWLAFSDEDAEICASNMFTRQKLGMVFVAEQQKKTRRPPRETALSRRLTLLVSQMHRLGGCTIFGAPGCGGGWHGSTKAIRRSKKDLEKPNAAKNFIFGGFWNILGAAFPQGWLQIPGIQTRRKKLSPILGWTPFSFGNNFFLRPCMLPFLAEGKRKRTS